jgi:hypothetical protein
LPSPISPRRHIRDGAVVSFGENRKKWLGDLEPSQRYVQAVDLLKAFMN